MSSGPPLVLLRGGGDLATGVAARLWRSGFLVLITEIERPLAVRRLVSLAEAVYAGNVEIEDLRAKWVADAAEALQTLERGVIPVMVDPQAAVRDELALSALVDGRMRKAPSELGLGAAPFIIGLGPGFRVGSDCHAVIETHRGHRLGRVIWSGSASPDTGIPESVGGFHLERVLRAPADGVLNDVAPLGKVYEQGEVLARVDGAPLHAPFRGALRGLLHEGMTVSQGLKVGDLDPRAEVAFCFEISDKALAIGGGVLEALLSRSEIRRRLAS